MPVWFIPAIMAATAVASTAVSVSNAETQADNAEASSEWGAYNAAVAKQNANLNASAIEQVADVNAQYMLYGAATDANIAQSLAEYNATLRLQAAEYNANLVESEAIYAWEAQELDQLLFKQQVDQLIASSRNAYAAAGIEVNSGSPVDLLVDQTTQAALESFIIRHNADIEMSKLMDAASLGRWQGEMEAAAILHEGKMSALSSISHGVLGASQIETQAAYDAVVTRYGGDVQSNQISQSAEITAANQRDAASQTLANGLLSGASQAAQAAGSFSSTIPQTDTAPSNTGVTYNSAFNGGGGANDFTRATPLNQSSMWT